MRKNALTPKQHSWRTIVRLPAFLIINVALLFVIGISTVRESYRGWTVDREINALEAQATALEGRKLQLETLTRDLVSTDRVEYEARARLGRKQPGERVIVLEGYSTSATWSGDEVATDVIAPAAVPEERQKTNPERWWSYFFRNT
jgi:cell division protein FtsB